VQVTPTLAPPRPTRAGAAPALTIGIDARAAAEVPAGRGRVVRELLRALAERDEDRQRYVLYTRRTWEDATLDERFRWKPIAAREPWWHPLAARQANRECDVFLACNSYLTGRFLRIPSVPIVYDLVAFETALRPNRRSQAIERLTLGPAARRSAALLAISQTTAEALARRYPAAAARTAVAPLGVAPALHSELDPAAAATLPAPGFVLAVGTLEPRKNLPRLVAAYHALEDSLKARHQLVVVGANGWKTGPTLASLRSLGDRCVTLGHVSDAVLAELYRRCAVFCYPSLGEGFGLPVLEAMSAGAAVLTSDCSSLPEVGSDAVEYADPQDVASIAAGLERMLADEPLRAELSRRARARAQEFSWERFAAQALEVLAGATARPIGSRRSARRHPGQVSPEDAIAAPERPASAARR
jgi:glycosyltransferase involved in cell wall biosynthesis